MKKFADLSKGLFFLASTLSLMVAMYMFIFVWQPIWTAGFNDFHTISKAINDLNRTAQPASASVPLMLEQMADMNDSILDMKLIMQDMNASMKTIEQINPNILQINASMENMTMVVDSQMSRISYMIDRMENKLSPIGMMPFNW